MNAAEQGAEGVSFLSNSLPPHEVAEVGWKQLARRAEVAFELALRTHPHIFDIVGMDKST